LQPPPRLDTKAAQTKRDERSVVFVLALLALVGCTTIVRQNPNFAARRSQISAVAVMPPEVKVRLITFKGDNPPLDLRARADEGSSGRLLRLEPRGNHLRQSSAGRSESRARQPARPGYPRDRRLFRDRRDAVPGAA
jgi:hypothetical protein